MWTLTDVFAASELGAYTSDWFGAVPLIEKPASPDSMLQLTPLPEGSASLNDRPLATPSPLLLRVTVKPICSPALTESASACFSTSTSAHSTSVESLASSEPSLAVLTDAVLS